MRAKVGDGWRYKVYLNGTNVSKVTTEAVSILGWGYVQRFKEHEGFIVFDKDGARTYRAWGRVSIIRLDRM